MKKLAFLLALLLAALVAAPAAAQENWTGDWHGTLVTPRGQLRMLLRAKFLVDVESYTKVQGQPILAHEMEVQIQERTTP